MSSLTKTSILRIFDEQCSEPGIYRCIVLNDTSIKKKYLTSEDIIKITLANGHSLPKFFKVHELSV